MNDMATRADMKRRADGEAPEGLSVLVGVAAVVFSALYFVSDVIELAQHGFSTPQLALRPDASPRQPAGEVTLEAEAR